MENFELTIDIPNFGSALLSIGDVENPDGSLWVTHRVAFLTTISPKIRANKNIENIKKRKS